MDLRLHMQAWRGWLQAPRGSLAWVGQGLGLLAVPAELLLALHNLLVMHPSLHLLEAWKDSRLLQVVVGIRLPEEGSLQLGQGSHQPGEGSPLLLEGSPLLLEGNRLLLEGSRLLLEGSRQPEVGIHLPVGGSLLPVEGSPLLLVGNLLLLEGSRLLGVDIPLTEVGSPLPGVGIHQTEEGNLGSSSSEPGGDMKLWSVTRMYI